MMKSAAIRVQGYVPLHNMAAPRLLLRRSASIPPRTATHAGIDTPSPRAECMKTTACRSGNRNILWFGEVKGGGGTRFSTDKTNNSIAHSSVMAGLDPAIPSRDRRDRATRNDEPG